jgi:MFS family permease
MKLCSEVNDNVSDNGIKAEILVNPTKAKKLSRSTPWIVCLSAALFFFYEFIQSNMFSSIATDVMADFHINAESYSHLSSVYFLANVIFLFPAGTILDRFSTKRVILISLGLCILGTFLFAHSSHYSVALICRFLTGIGSAFCFLACIRLASRWFPSNRLALATGVIVTFAMTGGLIAQTPLTLLIEHFNWRTAITLDALLGIIIFVAILFLVKDHPASSVMNSMGKSSPKAKMSVLKSMKTAYFKWSNLFCALYTSLMNMPIVVLGAMAGSIYLTQAYNLSREEASYSMSVLFLGTLIGSPLVGSLSDYIGRKRSLMIIGALLSLGVVLVLLYVPLMSMGIVLGLFFLLGFLTSTQILAYPMVAENNPHELTATAVSVVSIFSQGGPILYQNLFGHLLQKNWDGTMINEVPFYSMANYQHALWIIPAGFIIALIAVLFLKEKTRS